MLESLGNQFRDAREAKGLAVEEVARALKMKAARVEDLEKDIYSNFPSVAYAKGFVLNYGKLLGVDTKPYLAMFDCSHAAGLSGCQFLENAEPTDHLRPLPREGERKGRSPLRKVVVAGLVVLLVAGVVGAGGVVIRLQQLGYIDWFGGGADKVEGVGEEVAEQGEVDPFAVPSLTGEALESLLSETIERLVEEDRALLQAQPPPSPEQLRAGSDNESVIVIRPIKRTFVRVLSGDPDSEPLFQSVLEPGAAPVELSGTRFFIESSEDQALEIYRDGQVVAQPSGRVVID